jgi:hypothetical protein
MISWKFDLRGQLSFLYVLNAKEAIVISAIVIFSPDKNFPVLFYIL